MTGDRKKHGGNLYEAMRCRGGSLADYYDFSANINPMGLSPRVRIALQQSMEAVVCYPDPDATSLKQAIAECYQVHPDNIETGNGAVELIYLLCRAVSPERVLIPAPTFSEYAAAAGAAGLPVETIVLRKEDGFAADMELFIPKLRVRDLLFVCNPNNPTGTVLTCSQLEPLIAAASSVGAHVVVDESFIDFRDPEAKESCRMLVGKYDSLSVLHSLTKFLAIPGLRLGFLLTSENLAKKTKSMRDPWNVNVMAQAAGVAGLADQEYRRQTLDMVGREKEYLFREFQKLPGFQPFPPSVNFMLSDIGSSGWDAGRLQAALWPHRIMVRNCENFIGLSDSHIRVAVKSPAENRLLVNRLKKMICGEDEQ